MILIDIDSVRRWIEDDMKHAIVFYFSHTGQTKRMVEEFAQGLSETFTVEMIPVEPSVAFDFPWKINDFFRRFPDTYGPSLCPLTQIPEGVWRGHYDLVVLGFPIWFLSSAWPIHSLFEMSEFQKLVNGRPVVGLVTCRNLWLTGVDRANARLSKMGVQSIRNFVLRDPSPAWASVVTTPRWMFTGKRGPFLFFPKAGIPDTSFATVRDFGRRWGASNSLSRGDCNVDAMLVPNVTEYLMEIVGSKFFRLSALMIERVTKRGSILRDVALLLFRVNLVLLICALFVLGRVAEFVAKSYFRRLIDVRVESSLCIQSQI